MFDTIIKGRGYETEPFAFDECVAIQLELGKILGGVAGPVVEFASALFTVNPDEGTATYDPSKIKAADKQALGRAITALPAGIIAAGGPKFIRRILAKTSIEVESIDGKGGKEFQPLSSANYSGIGTWLDEVYTGGNAEEMYLALGWIITVNFSPFGHSGSWTWSSLWLELTGAIPKLSSLSIGTTPPNADGETDKESPTP